jgi:hypothetical protein
MRSAVLVVAGTGDSLGSLGDLPLAYFSALRPVAVFAAAPAGMYVGLGDSAVVSLYSVEGRPIRMLAAGSARRAPTAAEYDAAIDALMSVFRTAADRDVGNELAHRVPKPDFVPAYRSMHSDAQGVLYVVASPLGAGATTIQVINPERRPSGEIRIPGDVDVYEVGAGYLLGRSTDAGGRQHVVVHSLTKEADMDR